MASEPVLSMAGVHRRFKAGGTPVQVLAGLDLEVERGERVAIMGASGSGKSTLLHLAAGMDRADAGRVRLQGRDLHELPEPALTRHRAAAVGLVFQDFNLVESLTAAENIELPLWLTGKPLSLTECAPLLSDLGIDHLLDRLPEQLSGGEKQRIAIARALVHQPALLLADEPTGALDQDTAANVLELFDRATRQRQCTLVMVTHNPEAAAMCDRVLQLRRGRLSIH